MYVNDYLVANLLDASVLTIGHEMSVDISLHRRHSTDDVADA
jgi:hypothetical protein